MECKNCGKEIGESKFCTYCGSAADDENNTVICPNCQSRVQKKRFCTVCGAQMEGGAEESGISQNTVSAQQSNASVYSAPKEPSVWQKMWKAFYKEWKKTKIYNFYTRHRLPVLAVIALLLLVFIISLPSMIKSSIKSREINRLYESAIEYRDNNSLSKMENCIDSILNLDKDNKKAQKLREELKEKYYNNALNNQKEGRYYDALENINHFLKYEPDNEEAKRIKAEIEAQYKDQQIKESIQSAKTYKDEGKYIEGYNAIKKAIELDPNNVEANQLKDELLPLSQEQERQKAEAEAKAKAEAEAQAKAKAEAEAQAAQQSAPQQSASSTVLDKQFYGNGYIISYPSSYIEYQESGIIMIMDPVSGANISVFKLEDLGNIDGMTSQDFTDVMSMMGLNVSISGFHELTIDGYKCYAAQYTLEGLIITQFIVGDGTDAYYVTYTAPPDISTETDEIMTSIIYSFDIN